MMDTGMNWKAKALLTCLFAAESGLCLPNPAGLATTGTTAALETQYPPSDSEERLAISKSKPVYRVALENEGHPAEQPFPNFGGSRYQSSGDNQHSNDDDEDDDDNGFYFGDFGGFDGLDSVNNFFNPDPVSSSSVAQEHAAQTSPETVPETARNKYLAASKTSVASEDDSEPTSNPSQTTGTEMNGQNIFEPVSTGPPAASIKSRDDHPVANDHAISQDPIETNKFYAGLFLGSQTNATFTQPYSLAWSKGTGHLQSWGMGVSHVEANLLAYGPENHNITGSPVSYYINPVGLQHIIFSAKELTDQAVMHVEHPKAFSANAVVKNPGNAHSITFPVVQGMGYVTAIYSGMEPIIESGVFFRKVVNAGSPKSGIFKYQVFLEDETVWLLYATPNDGKDPHFKLVSKNAIHGPEGFAGTVQVAKNPAGKGGEKFFDNSSGVYPVAGHINGSVSSDVGTYELSWTKAGKHVNGTPLIMYALPHHVQSFDPNTHGGVTDIHLRTTTKGNATAVIGESWTMTEANLPVDIGFAPWSASHGAAHSLSPDAQKAILDAAPEELKQDIEGQTNLNSMYYSGKALSKFATIIYTINQLANNVDTANKPFADLKKSFARFVDNKQQYPLAYDAVWKGVVSTAGYDGDLNQDFGNTAYNDHHFHYGYFIHAAAIIGALDPDWLKENKDWVNTLVRDAGNSIETDQYFPFSRSFDWYNGHSWAKGLFESFDGKDQESTSEDTMFAYAIKMWGKTTGDRSMEARGNMMLGIMRRSLDSYFLMKHDNVNQPSNFTSNRVTGILFENKVDHTTYFGANIEYIQGIHMLPLLPHSAYTRQHEFVAQEWKDLFSPSANTPAHSVDGGWKGVLFANLALIDPQQSWDFFAQPKFDYSWIDGGASRTWYLAYAAGLGGGPN